MTFCLAMQIVTQSLRREGTIINNLRYNAVDRQLWEKNKK